MTDETRRLLDKLDRNLNDILFDLVEENETLEGQVDELREQVARLAGNKENNTMDIYSDLLRVKHGTMSIDSLIDKVWSRERRGMSETNN